jgi:hypothetical protein
MDHPATQAPTALERLVIHAVKEMQGRPAYWKMVRDIADRHGLDDDTVDGALRSAIGKQLLLARSGPA